MVIIGRQEHALAQVKHFDLLALDVTVDVRCCHVSVHNVFTVEISDRLDGTKEHIYTKLLRSVVSSRQIVNRAILKLLQNDEVVALEPIGSDKVDLEAALNLG